MQSPSVSGNRGALRWSGRKDAAGVWWGDVHLNGKRERKRFPTRAVAETWCRQAEDRARVQGAQLAQTPAAEVTAWRDVFMLAKEAGLDPLEAMRAGVQALKARMVSVPVREAVEAFLKAKEVPADSKGWSDFRTLRSRMSLFLGSGLVDRMVCDLTALELDDWLKSRRVSEVTRASDRVALGRFLNWSADRGWCDPLLDKKLKAKRTAPAKSHEVLDLSELAALLDHAEPELRAVLVLVAMCGVRTAEARRLRWGDDVRLADGVVIVSPEVAKVSQRRVIPIPEGARAWLATCEKPAGERVWSAGEDERSMDTRYQCLLRSCVKKLGLKWSQNALRRAALSYLRALEQDDGKAATLGGTSARMVSQRYASAVTRSGKLLKEADGRAWSSMAPTHDETVVQFSRPA